MADVTSLVLAVDSRQARTAAADLDRLTAAGRRTEGASQALQSSFRGLGPILSGAIAADIVRRVISTADAYTTLNARLRLATSGAVEYNRAQQGLFAIAQRTRSGLGETVDLYASLARSTKDLGVSQAVLLETTETINQAVQLSGASSQAAAAALVQLGQGFASGTLRGEELNSILEQTPRLAKAIADGLGVSVGALRRLGQEGQLTGDKVFRALQRSADGVRREFQTLPTTVAQSTQQMGNALSALIGEIDSLSGASTFLAARLSAQAGAITVLTNELKLAKIEGAGFAETLSRLGAFFVPFGGRINTAESRVAELGKRLEEVNSLLNTPRRAGLFTGQAAELERERAKIEASLSALRGTLQSRESFSDARFASLQAARPAAAPAAVRRDSTSEAQRYLETLLRQLDATQNLTVTEQLLKDIQGNRIQGLNAGLREQLLLVAGQIDLANRQESQREAEANQVRDMMDFRRQEATELQRMLESSSLASTRALEQAIAEAASLADVNEALRDEIAIIEGGELARRSIEKARLDSAIALKEETKAQLENAGAARAQIAVLEQEIALLRQKRGLLGKRDEALDTAEVAREQQRLLSDVANSVAGGLEGAILNGGKLRDVLGGIEQDLMRILTRKLVTEPFADALLGLLQPSSGNVLGSLFGSLFGGGFAAGGDPPVGKVSLVGEKGPELFVPKSAGTVIPADLTRLALGRGLATGGTAKAGYLHPINERGTPEVLTIQNRDFVMMGAQSGTVTPSKANGGIAEVRVINNFNISGPVDRSTEEQIAAKTGRAISKAINRRTS